MTAASHSSGFIEHGQMIYMGEPCGFVVRLEDDRTIYFAGDTDVFGDMRLIGEIYRPEIRVPADRRSLYDGASRRGARMRVARGEAGRADALGNVPAADGNADRAQAAG
jgi:hypothetical protein